MLTNYHAKGKIYTPDESDRVKFYSAVKKKEVQAGYNHSRAWLSALNA